MLRPEVALDPCVIYLAAGNQDDEILHGCQRSVWSMDGYPRHGDPPPPPLTPPVFTDIAKYFDVWLTADGVL